MIITEWDLVEPGVKVLVAEFVNISVAVDFNVVLCLHDIDSVEHIKQALAFDRHSQLFIQHIEEYIGSALIWSTDGEVVDLTHEDDAFAVNSSQVQARLVGCRCEPKFP